AQGEWALQENRFDIAANLFEQAHDLDPTSAEAKGMVDLVARLRDGKITREQLREALRKDRKVRVGNAGPDRGVGDNLLALGQAPEKPEVAPPPIAPPVAGEDILAEARRRQAVEDQKAAGLVDDVVRQAMRTLPSDPDAARDYLRRTLDAIRSDANLSAA